MYGKDNIMGVDVELKVGKLELMYWKSYFDRYALGLFFSDRDLVITENVKNDREDVDEQPHTEYKYSTTVQKAIDRLEATGYTMKKARDYFNKNIYRCLDYFSILHDLHINLDDYDEIQEARIKKHVTFLKWCNSVWKYARYGMDNGLYLYFRDNYDPCLLPKTECDRIVFNSLIHPEDSFFGCLHEEFDRLFTIRVILEKCPRDEELFVDITEMVGWTYSSIDEMRLGEPTEKTIILVEGTNDKAILEFALKNFYPHLYDLYYFMDFEIEPGKKRKGGTDALANNLKAFVYSKLQARFIAVFDNDTAGTQAMKRLVYEIGTIPENVRVISYPNIRRANRYPTIGTNGKVVFDNINGRACSIELYLPDFLLKNGQQFSPVEWESRMKTRIGDMEHHEYQGVISSKADIEIKFKKFKKLVENGERTVELDEWIFMKQLVDSIIHAFDI